MIINQYGKLVNAEIQDQFEKNLASIKDISVPTMFNKKHNRYNEINTQKKMKEARNHEGKIFYKEKICMEVLYGNEDITKGFE